MPRKKKKFHFIYKTTNLLNGKYYIGMHSTDNLDDGYLGSGRRLRYSINKHGKNNHEREILEFVDSRGELIKREEEIVSLNEIAKDNCLNLKVGGTGGFKDEEHRHNFINSTGPKNFAKKMKEDEEFREKHSKVSSERMKKTHREGKIKYDTFTNKKHSEKTKEKMSESSKGMNMGSKNGSYGTCWITRGGINKKIKKEKLEIFTQKGWVKGRK